MSRKAAPLPSRWHARLAGGRSSSVDLRWQDTPCASSWPFGAAPERQAHREPLDVARVVTRVSQRDTNDRLGVLAGLHATARCCLCRGGGQASSATRPSGFRAEEHDSVESA